MVTMEAIEGLAQRIADKFHPEQIILFGSYAYGHPREDSDVDLLVIMPYEGHPIYKSLEILNTLNPPFSVDLLIRSPEEVEQRLIWNDFFLREVTSCGRTLYESTYARVG